MGKVAFVFSGQGAQYSGMGKSLYEASPAAKAVFDTAELSINVSIDKNGGIPGDSLVNDSYTQLSLQRQ